MLFVGAFAQDGGGAVVEDGGGLDGGQAACGDGAATDGVVRFGWTGVCFCGRRRNRTEPAVMLAAK